MADVLQARPLKKKKKKRAKESYPVLRCCPVNVAPPPFSFDLSLLCLPTACGLFSPFLVRCLAPRRKPVSYVPLLPIFVAIAWVWRHAASLVGLPRVLSALSTCFPIYARTPGAKLCLAFSHSPCLLGSTMLLRLRAHPSKSAMVSISGHVPAYDDLVLLFSLSACSAFLFLLSPLLLCFVRAEAGFEDSPFTRTGLGPRLAVVGVGGWFGRVFRLGLKSN